MIGKEGSIRAKAILCLFLCMLIGQTSANAAFLRWAENSDEDIAFYSVYAEFATGTFRHEVHDSTSFDLDFLPPNTHYTLYVTATSAGGLESKRSVGIPFSFFSSRPWVASHPTGASVALGKSLSLSVVASSSSAVSYQWKKDGQVLPGQTSSELRIGSVSTAHAGSYSVVVANSSGSVESKPALIIVQAPPKIFVQPRPAPVREGTHLLLSVGAEGSSLNYQWLKNGDVIHGATNATYSISGIKEEDQGIYKVTISNHVGAVESSEASVQVLPVISIVQQPGGGAVPLGGSLRLSVVANGPAPLKYQWYHGSVALDGETNSELILNNVDAADTGVYTARISSIVETVVSGGAQVNVVQGPSQAECRLSLSKMANGFLSISGTGAANTTFELQIADDIQAPAWRYLQGITTDAQGRFQVTMLVSGTGPAFVRAARR